MTIVPFSADEAAFVGFTHRIILKSTDINSANFVSGTAFQIYPSLNKTADTNGLPAGFRCGDFCVNVVTAPAGGTLTTFVAQAGFGAAGVQLLAAATSILTAGWVTDNALSVKPVINTTATNAIDLLITITGGGTIAGLTAGEWHFYLQLFNMNRVDTDSMP